MTKQTDEAAERVRTYIEFQARFGGDLVSAGGNVSLTLSDLRTILAELDRFERYREDHPCAVCEARAKHEVKS